MATHRHAKAALGELKCIVLRTTVVTDGIGEQDIPFPFTFMMHPMEVPDPTLPRAEPLRSVCLEQLLGGSMDLLVGLSQVLDLGLGQMEEQILQPGPSHPLQPQEVERLLSLYMEIKAVPEIIQLILEISPGLQLQPLMLVVI